jgi:hypothetical protein
MRNENLEIIKVALAVVAPWPIEYVLDGRVSLLSFTHVDDGDSKLRM